MNYETRHLPGTRLTGVPPAGWGKTTLLADWSTARRETRPFGWFALDAADNDPIRFWSPLIEAVRRIDPDLGLDAARCCASRV